MAKRKIKALFLPAWYPWPGDPMSGLFVHYHAIAVSRFAEVAVLFVCGTEKAQETQITHDIEDGIPVVRSYYRKAHGPIRLPITAFRYLFAACRGYGFLEKKWGKPDITHVNILTRAGIPALWLKLKSGMPYMITEHWSRYLPRNKGSYSGALRKWCTQMVVKHAGVVTAVSSELIQAMKNHGLQNENYHYLPNVVDTARFFPGKSANAEPFTFLHVSCFDEKPKNVKGILRAWQQFLLENNSCQLKLVGDGPDFREVKEYALNLGLNDSVEFTGLLTGEALASAFRKANCFVLFSNYENQPVVIIEALASGIPVISTSVGGIPDMINEQNGLLVAPGDEAALTSAMLKMHKSSDNYSSAEISSGVREHFGYEAVGRRITDFYEFLLNDKG